MDWSFINIFSFQKILDIVSDWKTIHQLYTFNLIYYSMAMFLLMQTSLLANRFEPEDIKLNVTIKKPTKKEKTTKKTFREIEYLKD